MFSRCAEENLHCRVLWQARGLPLCPTPSLRLGHSDPPRPAPAALAAEKATAAERLEEAKRLQTAVADRERRLAEAQQRGGVLEGWLVLLEPGRM